MATLAVFLYPEKVGIARVKAPGNKPSYSSLQWRMTDNVNQLLEEPLMLAALIREMVGDENRYDIYMNVWPGAYNAVMFSHDKKTRGDLKRLRQSELETVFRGEFQKMSTADLILAKGKPTSDGKCHQIIFTFPRERIKLLRESFSQRKMTIKRIAPMDVACAEAVMKYWAPKDKSISVCMVLDEGCTSIFFLRHGILHAMRTIPNGFGTVLSTYKTVSGLDHDTCVEQIKANGVHGTDGTDMPTIQDDVLRLLNRITGETVKTLHNTFDDDAVIDRLLLCGNFVRTVGLVEYLNTMLNIECVVADAETLKPNAKNAIVLDEADLEVLFPVASTASAGADLMAEMKKNQADKIQSIVVCSILTVAVAGLMSIMPQQVAQAQQIRDAASNIMSSPEYVAVQELFDERDALNRQKNSLVEAIEGLPHGVSKTAELVQDIYDITTKYGTVLELTTDYGSKTIMVSFTTLNYDSFVYWQKEITENGKYSFLEPAEFSGNGLIYTVEANMTAVVFEELSESTEVTDADAGTDTAEGNG